MSDKKNRSLFAKREIRKFTIALFPLLLVSIAYYFHMRNDALHQAEKRALITLQSTEDMIHARMGKIETTVKALIPMAEYALDDPDAMYDIAGYATEASSRVMGAGIAFKADYYPEKGHWFETYVGYQNGCDTLVTRQLGSESHNYLEMDWFKKGMESTTGFWSEPYFDNAGGKAFMISYCAPIREKTGGVVGLIIADITLDTLASIVKSVRLYPHSFCTLVSTNGTVLVAPPASHSNKRKCHIYSEDIEGKNMTLSIIIPDADMYRRLWLSSLFFVVMALTGILSVLIITYHSLKNLRKLDEVRIKEQHIEDELAIARNIQQSLLPSNSVSSIAKDFEIKGLQIPAKFVGGDIFDYYVRGNKLLFCIGDVSGKGVPAALLMAISHSLFRTLSAHDDQPNRIMEALNAAISDNNPDIMFITMFLGILDFTTSKVNYCNAGHNPPIIVKDGHAEYLNTEPSLLMGVDIHAEYSSYCLELAPGDTLFLYTDGLTEAENEQKELFGEQRALDAVSKASRLSVVEQLGHVKQAVEIFVNQAEQSDDLTLLAIRRTPVKEILTLNNDIEELNKLEPFLNSFFQKNDVDQAILSKLDLALEEALANVIMYAYPKGENGEVSLAIELKDGVVCSEISDRGMPFNPLHQQEANLDVALEERKIGGLGIHLIKEIMDSVGYEYKEGKNILKLELTVNN
jgi:serine phosphatase RsbU (regulator of sigma subunit)